MCSKFYLDNLKTVGEIRDTIFHQQTYCLTVHLMTPVYPLPSPSSLDGGMNM